MPTELLDPLGIETQHSDPLGIEKGDPLGIEGPPPDVFERFHNAVVANTPLAPAAFAAEKNFWTGIGKAGERTAGNIAEGLARISTVPSQLEYAPTFPGAGFGQPPANTALLPTPNPPANIPRSTEGLNKRYLDALRNNDQLYQLGKVAAEAGQPTPEESKDFWFKAGSEVGGAAPMALGPLAPAAFSLSSIGESTATDYERIKKEHPEIDDNDAADQALQLATEKGLITAATFEVLPKVLRGPLEKYLVNKWGTTAFKNWLAGRVAAGTEGAVLMGTQAAGERAAEGKPPDAETAKAAAGGFLFNILMPWRQGQESARGGEPTAPESPTTEPTTPTPVNTGKDTPTPAQQPGIVSVGDAFKKALEDVSKRSGVAPEDLLENLQKEAAEQPKPEEQEVQNAIPERSAATIPVEIPPEHRPQVGQRVLEPEEPAKPQEPIQPPETAPTAATEPAKVKPKGGRFFIRPRSDGVTDILDAIQELGGIRPAGKDAGGEYDAFKESLVGPARLLINRSAAHGPDTIIGELHNLEDSQGWQRIQNVDDLYNEIRSAVAERDELRAKGGGEEARLQRFWDAATNPKSKLGLVKINVSDLKVTHKFRLKGPEISNDELEVTHIDPDTYEVTVKDGRKLGTQTLPDGTEIWVQRKYAPPGTTGEVQHAAGDFSFDQPEGVKEQRARTDREQQETEARDRERAAEEARASRERAIRQRLKQRIGGDMGEAAQGGLFEEPGQQEMFRPKVKARPESQPPIESTPQSRVESASSRFRPREKIVFEKPLIGPNGNELIAYEWKWMPEAYVDKYGEERTRRVSDWDEAVSSSETGRDLVHHFYIKTPGGERVVSSEAVPSWLGFTDKTATGKLPSLISATKTMARLRMQLAVANPKSEAWKAAEAQAAKETPPPIKYIGPSVLKYGSMAGQVRGQRFGAGEMHEYGADFPVGKDSVEKLNWDEKDSIKAGWRWFRAEQLAAENGAKAGDVRVAEDLERRINKQQSKIDAILKEQEQAPPERRPGELFAAGQRRGLSVDEATQAIHEALGTTELPRGIRVTRDESAGWGARIDNRDRITVNAAQVSSPERAARVIMEEGLHGVWHDPRVQNAWEKIRRSVTPEDMRKERDLREPQGLPTDPETLREEAAISKLLDADANKGVFAELYDYIRKAFKDVFGIDLPSTNRQVLKDAAVKFLKGERESLPGRRLVADNAVITAPGVSPEYAAMAYHGTPHKITDRFQTSKIGSGEGAQVYGWGLYFAENPEVAQQYARTLARWQLDGRQLPPSRSTKEIQLQYGFPERESAAISAMTRLGHGETVFDAIESLKYRAANVADPMYEQAADWLAQNSDRFSKGGKTYTVRLNVSPDDLLDWDKPLNEQPKRVRDALSDYNPEIASGRAVYDITSKVHGFEGTSKELQRRGIRGIRYLDQGSRQQIFHGLEVVPMKGGKWHVYARGGTSTDMPLAAFDTKSQAEAYARETEKLPEQTYNYVIFDDKDIAITHENGQPIPLEQAINQPVFAAGEYLPSESERDWRELHTERESVTKDLADLNAEIDKAGGRRNAPVDLKNRTDAAIAKHKALTAQLRQSPGYVEDVLNQFSAAKDDMTREDLKGELTMIEPDLLNRVYQDMQKRGIIPASQKLPEPFSSLQGLTDWLRAHEIDSPKRSIRERLNIAKRAADIYQTSKDTLQKAWNRSVALAKTAYAIWDHPPIDDDYRALKKDWNVFDEQTGQEAYRFQQAINARVSKPERRAAIMAWIQAGGMQEAVEQQLAMVPERFKPIWKAATQLTADEKKLANQIRSDWAVKLDIGQNAGLVDKGRQNYGPTVWSVAPQIAEGDSTFAIGGALERQKGSPGNPNARLDPRNPFFSYHKSFPTFFDGIMAGGIPETMDIGKMVAYYHQAFNKALSSRAVVKAMMDAKAKDGRPVVVLSGRADPMTTADGETKGYVVDSTYKGQEAQTADGRPYQAVNHFALKDWKFVLRTQDGKPILARADMLVHPDHVEDLKNVLGKQYYDPKTNRFYDSPIRRYAIGRGAIKFNRFLKESKFALSPFHLATLAEHALSHTVNPWTGNFQLDLNDPEQRNLVRGGLDLGFSGERVDFQEGLSSHGGLWSKIPGIGDLSVKLTDFIFKDYLPAIKMKMGLEALQRNKKRYSGKLTDEQIYDLTASQANAAFGSQNYRLLGRSPMVRDLLSLSFVAPDFLSSRIKFVGQAFQKHGAEQRRALMIMSAVTYLGARVINALVDPDNDPHWGLKDAFSVVYKGRRYGLRTVVGDLWHAVTDPRSFWYNRISPIARAGVELMTHKDWRGVNRSTVEQLQDVASWIVPTSAEGLVPGATKRDTGIAESVGRSVGIMSRKETPATQILDKARDFNRSSKDPAAVAYQKARDQETLPDSDYRDLDTLLEADNLKAARAEYDRLLKEGHKPAVIATRYRNFRPFTGTIERDKAFYNSLSPADRRLYDRARAEHEQEYQKFLRIAR